MACLGSACAKVRRGLGELSTVQSRWEIGFTSWAGAITCPMGIVQAIQGVTQPSTTAGHLSMALTGSAAPTARHGFRGYGFRRWRTGIGCGCWVAGLALGSMVPTTRSSCRPRHPTSVGHSTIALPVEQDHTGIGAIYVSSLSPLCCSLHARPRLPPARDFSDCELRVCRGFMMP